MNLFRRHTVPRASVLDKIYAGMSCPKRILMVDDSAPFLDFMSKVVSTRFCVELVVAGSVEEARRKLETEKFDAVILDVVMVNGSGIDLYQEILSRWPYLEVAFLTVNGNEEYRRRIHAIGPARIFIKEYVINLSFISKLFESWHIPSLQPAQA